MTSVLVVEDENIVAKDIANRLRHLGYKVSGLAGSGEEAIRLAAEDRPDLVLMDIMLRGSMDGIQAAEVISTQHEIPVIYLTAYADEKTLQRAKRTEAFGYLLKPFEERELHITIEMALFKNQMERRLRESEQWMSAVLRSIGDAVIATDTLGTIRFMNSVAEQLTGWTQAESVGQPLSVVFPIVDERTRESISNPVQNALRGNETTRLVMRTLLLSRDGREVPIDDSAAPIRNTGGDITGVVLVFRDVTERRRSEEALRQSQSQLAGIVGSAMDAIVTIDTDYRILLFNQAAEKMFGISAREAVGEKVDGFIPERFRLIHETHIGNFGASGTTRRQMGNMGLVFGVRNDGEEFPIEASISQIEVGGKKFFTVILRDVSDRNRLEEQLRQAQKMESIGTLASGIAHDFNNVLNNVLGFSMQLRKHITDEAKVRKYVDTIERSAQRGADLASQLLSFARSSRRHTSPTDVAQICTEVVASSRDSFPPDIRVDSSIPGDLPHVLGDHGELYQVIMNLCVNARDAIAARGNGGGTLSVSARSVVIGRDVGLQLFAAHGNEYVEISVADTGVGIPEEIRAKIFDPFFTTKERGRGTGLGLSIVYNIVRSHHGTITVDSEVGGGSTFHVYLPALHPREPMRKETGRPARCILLVDDEQAMQDLGRELLEDEGYSVLLANNGVEAIDIYREKSSTIDLVILDLVMPNMDGGQVYVSLKAINPALKAFFCTGFVSDQLIASLLQEEKLQVVSKPFRPEQFLRTVREVIGE
jgi:two-component system cell cycle sensor histidine kinase/response regulator CckA